MPAFPVQNLGGTVTPSYTAPATSNQIRNVGRGVFVHLKIGATSTTVTLVGQAVVDGQTVKDRVLSGLISTERIIGPIHPVLYNKADGDIDLNLNQVVGVTMAVFEAP